MTEGQELALEQLREVARFGARDLEVVELKPDEPTTNVLRVDLSLRTGHLARAEDGLPLRDRERVLIDIPPDFPFERPTVETRHSRFAGFPHVQFSRHLCLYQAPGVEWNPSDGFFGFLTRLEEWLAQGAANQLDPVGGPLHPPAIYPTHPQLVIPRMDAPAVGADHWYGLARLSVVSDRRLDIVGWLPAFGQEVVPPVGAAVLLASTMPWEFPRSVRELVTHLEALGVERGRLLFALQVAVIRNPEDAPLYVVIGAPMRGIRGGELRQHLSVWFIEPMMAKALRLAVEKYSQHERLQEIGAEVEAIIWDWAERVKVSWCNVREDRPEIVTRRDHSSPMAFFRNKTVALWGCGALGSHVAEHLVRAGVRRLVLRDSGVVAPGLLVRQQFDDADVGKSKAGSLALRLKRIRGEVDVEVELDDLVTGLLSAESWDDDVDVIIESTGSQSVLKKLERRWASASDKRPAVASLVVGPAAERALAVVARAGQHSGGPLDVTRRAKLAACADESLLRFRREFWPDTGKSKGLFQPEPGCSDPTFVGSSADLAELAGAMTNLVARDASSTDPAHAHFILRHDLDTEPSERVAAHFTWTAERTVQDGLRGYHVRISDNAWASILSVIEEGRRRRGPRVETGGLLLGERDDASRVVWITDATEPPPDSRATRSGFVCGTKGCHETDAKRRAETLNGVHFVGMWHTHPGAPPEPSSIDLEGMARLVSSFDPPIAQALLVIVGHTPANPTPAAYLFRRDDFWGTPSASYLTRRATSRSWDWLVQTLRALLSGSRSRTNHS